MVKLTLYYPSFIDIDRNPESIDFKTLSDLNKNKAVQERLYPNETLCQLYLHKDDELFENKGRYQQSLFQKYRNEYWCACILKGTKSELEEAIKTLNVKTAKW